MSDARICSPDTGPDLQLIGEHFEGRDEAYLIVRQRDRDHLWRDVHFKYDRLQLARACETLRRFYLQEPMT